ncbi:hypothetical protein QBC36DRAFT_206207 [Triangularia setosa]|uniref:Uncharacterized protein n=1 Tax=Triangularia setosa TaxID=2587417 RepID=A0AAN7A8Y6_9PEZI|nr:hypothetical protein QBC36DRAFT_206207 [Podospora setosa]
MAPTIKPVSQGSHDLNPRRTIDPNCYGWNCLSDTAQAGVVLVIIFCLGLGWYMWHKLGKSDDVKFHRSSMVANLAALAGISRSNSPSGRRRSRRLSGCIYRRSHRLSGSIYHRSHSRPTSLASIREERGHQLEDSDSSTSPRRPSSLHVDMADLVNDNHQIRAPVMPPPPPGPAPIFWTAGPAPIFIYPPSYTPTPSNDSYANRIRFSSAVDRQVYFQPHPGSFQYGPAPMPPFPNGMPTNGYPNGPFLPPNHGVMFGAIANQINMSQSGAPGRPAENRRRSWFPFIKGTKRPVHARSISESATSTRQPPSPSDFCDLRLPPMRERGRSRLGHQPSIRLIDCPPSLQRQQSPRPYPQIGWRDESSSHNLNGNDDGYSEGIHLSELSFPSVRTSMRVHDGIPSSEVTSSNLNHDPHFEEYSPERRRQRSLKRFQTPTRNDNSDADDEDGGMSSSAYTSTFWERRRHRRQRPYSTSVLPPMPPSPDIQFPSPELQRVNVTFAEPRRERDGLKDRGREKRRRERTPAPRYNRERSDERSSAPRYRDRSRERSQERTPTRRHRDRSRGRGRVQRARENHKSRNNLLGRLRAFRMEMRGEHY